MDFGKVDQVEGIDFVLPPDHPLTEDLFMRGGWDKEAPLRVHVGCSVWGRKDWVGRLYPKGTKDKDFLACYVQQFNTIELNALFYNLQPRAVIEKWASVADEGFRFCPKFSDTISHRQQLKNAEVETDLFIDHMQSFGGKLGYSFLQLSDSFGSDRAGTLQDYLRRLPHDFRTCIELRREDWFRDARGVKDTWQLFRELGKGTVITDTSGRRDCLHMILTAPVAFIRFVGNNLHPTDYARVDSWADRLKTWVDKGLREIYFFIHTHNEQHSPELGRYVVEQFNQKFGAQLKPPKLIPEPPVNLSLF